MGSMAQTVTSVKTNADDSPYQAPHASGSCAGGAGAALGSRCLGARAAR